MGQVNDTYLQETQGGCYAMGEPWAVTDIYQANLADYRIKLLEQLQAKSFVSTTCKLRESLGRVDVEVVGNDG